MTKRPAFSALGMLITIMILSFAYMMIYPHSVKYNDEAKSRLTKKNMVSVAQHASFTYPKKIALQNLATATSYIVTSNGGSFKNLCSTNRCLRDRFASRMSIIRKCDGPDFKGCWHSGNKYFAGMVLNNGIMMSFSGANKYCKNGICGIILVDVNGFKGPNRNGQDIVSTYVRPNTLSEFK